jgi:hypothetical protein
MVQALPRSALCLPEGTSFQAEPANRAAADGLSFDAQ